MKKMYNIIQISSKKASGSRCLWAAASFKSGKDGKKMTYVMLIVGFVLLIKGADFFVEGSSAVARKLHIPAMVIGMTIVAMGTSLPECAVSVTASIAGSNELAVSNVVGSNIFNLMVVCGACALWTPMAVSHIPVIKCNVNSLSQCLQYLQLRPFL